MTNLKTCRFIEKLTITAGQKGIMIKKHNCIGSVVSCGVSNDRWFGLDKYIKQKWTIAVSQKCVICKKYR